MENRSCYYMGRFFILSFNCKKQSLTLNHEKTNPAQNTCCLRLCTANELLTLKLSFSNNMNKLDVSLKFNHFTLYQQIDCCLHFNNMNKKCKKKFFAQKYFKFCLVNAVLGSLASTENDLSN